jgi:protein SCO1
MRSIRTPIAVAIACVAFVICSVLVRRHSSRPNGAKVTSSVPGALSSQGLPEYGALPRMSLIDQDGKPFTLERMRGRVWIANFIFTTCPMACPLLSQRMSTIQRKIADDPFAIQLASFSIDPSHDTPAVLKQYGTRYQQNPARWTFITGREEDVLAVVSDGLLAAVDEAKGSPKATVAARSFVAMHGEFFVLIDQASRIRGYYHKDDAELDRLVADARALARGSA